MIFISALDFSITNARLIYLPQSGVAPLLRTLRLVALVVLSETRTPLIERNILWWKKFRSSRYGILGNSRFTMRISETMANARSFDMSSGSMRV